MAASEAHDSGLCAASAESRRRFSSDLLNLTLAGPMVNRHEKSGKDAGEWMPRMNQCWFAQTVVDVRRKYCLTIDRREADALEGVLSGCASTEMIFVADSAAGAPASSPPVRAHALRLYDRQSERADHVQGSEALQHHAGPEGSSGLPPYARPRRRRDRV